VPAWPRRLCLTDEGRAVLHASQTMLSAIEEFRTEVNQLHHQLRGELNIGIINNLVTQSHMHLTHALKSLSAHGPGVRINISMTTPVKSSWACRTATCTWAWCH
jgi:DNA-binding transcriptional LysR family regulator